MGHSVPLLKLAVDDQQHRKLWSKIYLVKNVNQLLLFDAFPQTDVELFIMYANVVPPNIEHMPVVIHT